MKKYHRDMKDTFDDLGTNVFEWNIGKETREVWPREQSPKVCQLCGWSPLQNQYWLYNAKRLITIQVGSQCVKNWVELKYGLPFEEFFDNLMVDRFKPWVHLFKSEYRLKKNRIALLHSSKFFNMRKKTLSTLIKKEDNLNRRISDTVEEEFDAQAVKKIYKNAQKLGFTLSSQLFGYGIFDD